MNYKEYFALAVPFIVSTITQPLLGAVDTAVLGRLSDSSFMGGVAIGTVIFNTMYWLFGFLRVSTSAFSAQSLGSRAEEDQYFAYFRPMAIAMFISIIFIVLQIPIKIGAFHIYNPPVEVLTSAKTYFNILIWGAPCVLGGYVNLGWLMGRKYVKETLFLQITTNVMNIVLDLVFVIILKKGVEGVAVATLISQLTGFILGVLLIRTKINLKTIFKYKSNFINKEAIKKIMVVNTNLMIRTVCLLTMTNMFIAKGSQFGKDILAANAVLFQIQYILAYFYDGLANASSVFVGKAVGENNIIEYKKIIRISNVSTISLSFFLALLLLVFKNKFILLFTNLNKVIELSSIYSFWLVIFPVIIGIGLVYYGIFSGCTFTGPIRDSMIISLIMFLISYFIFVPKFDNHGLWFSFILFSFGRSVVLYLYRNKLIVKIFSKQNFLKEF